MQNIFGIPTLNRDGKLVFAASAVRALDYSFLSVFLGVYLNLLDFTVFQAGIVFSAIMAGGALSNIVAVWKGDAIGRRRMLVIMSVLMVVGGALFPFASSVAPLVIISLFAITTSTGGDRTAFVSLDTAILAQTCDASQRTLVFSWYNLVGFATKALGALLIAVPALLQSWFGMEELLSFKVMFGLYAAVAAGGILLYAPLSSNAEPAQEGRKTEALEPRLGDSRSVILRMAGLFSLDAFGGGFMVRSFISFWFVSRFGVGVETVALIFFAGQLANAVSVMLATPVASRIGLINTMASTQVLSNLFMVALALSGNLWLAVTFFLLKELSNDMDVPTRQSYTMAIVPPEAMTAMASVTNLGRNIAQTVSPGVAGLIAQTTFLGAPILIGSAIKLVYNAALYIQFRSVKAPEEKQTNLPVKSPQGDGLTASEESS